MAKREAFKIYLKKGFEKEYEWRHRNIWTEVEAKIEASGVYDYSIFLDENTGDAFCCAEVQGGLREARIWEKRKSSGNGGTTWLISWKQTMTNPRSLNP